MLDEKRTKVQMDLRLDPELVERIRNAVWHLPPGWSVERFFEAGAATLLERLERRYNKSQPFAPR
jgi:hypothetical protein